MIIMIILYYYLQILKLQHLNYMGYKTGTQKIMILLLFYKRKSDF